MDGGQLCSMEGRCSGVRTRRKRLHEKSAKMALKMWKTPPMIETKECFPSGSKTFIVWDRN
jgi:hypothetical protein